MQELYEAIQETQQLESGELFSGKVDSNLIF
jgi:hypothetical protein